MKFNLKIIFHILSLLVCLNGIFMLLPLPVAFFYGETTWQAFLIAGILCVLCGGFIWLLTKSKNRGEIRKREGYLIVTLGWVVMSISGTLPYFISGAIPNFSDVVFETFSGYTTTGATILGDIESLPKSILFWRNLTQWIGGMGIIVLAIAILPLLGIGGMQLFTAEAPGISPDKLHPRITGTAKRLWFIYFTLTIVCTLLLKIGGMSWFDSLAHAFTTIASGGFSTFNASLANQTPFIHYVLIVFMTISGINFSVIYLIAKFRIPKVLRNEEFKTYTFVLIGVGLFVFIVLLLSSGESIEFTFRQAIFQVVSIITTTGYVTGDYTGWGVFMTFFFTLLFFSGASAGSTSGGVKIVRHLILIKNSVLEFKRLIHPSAIIPVRFNGKAIAADITLNILAFFLIYILIFAIGSVVMTALGLDFISSIGAVAASLGNVGPAIGSVGPAANYAHVPVFGKWFLSFLMLIGRLELFTVLILFTPYFWRV